MELEDIKLNKEEFEYYINHLNTNPKDLIFKKDKINFSYKKVAIQLEARNKCIKKLPLWANTLSIIYPKKLSLEQCSSEKTGIYKQNIAPKGNRFADLTGGFGVDTFYLSYNFQDNSYFELNTELTDIVKANFSQLGKSITTYNKNGVETVLNHSKEYDLIYLDPARRKEDKKVFRLEECTPNIVEHQKLLLNKTNILFSKHSPLLDLEHLKNTLIHLKSIHIVSVLNECKEILVIQDKTHTGKEIEIVACNLLGDHKTDLVTAQFENRSINCDISDENHDYIYIPNSSILKAGISEMVAKTFQLKKFSTNTHFYLSNTLHNTYPGRCFKIILKDHKLKSFKKHITKQKRDVICRNSTYKPDALAKKLNIVRGNDVHFVLSGKNNNLTTYFFDCERIF